jgi:DNA-binding GntR family transcriptional regulator
MDGFPAFERTAQGSAKIRQRELIAQVREQTMQILRKIHHNLDRYLRVHITARSGWQKAEVEDRNIVELCRFRDVRRATVMVDAHIMGVATELIEALTKRRARKK